MLLLQDVGLANGSHGSSHAHNSSLARVVDDDGFNEPFVESIPAHPLGVKPLGNQYFSSAPPARQALGSFGSLPDETVLTLLEFLEAQSLKKLGSTCRFLYAFCRIDELWKALFLESQLNASSLLPWKGSWRTTLLQLSGDAVSKIDCSNVFSDVLHRPFACSHIMLKNYVFNIPRENQIARLENITQDEFAQKWSNKPFILTNYISSWPVYKDWDIEKLKGRYSDVEFRAEAVDWPFSAYCSYMSNNDDESPLYLFDRKFAEKMGVEVGHTQNAAYWPPECFGEDLFQLLGRERPAHHWLIIGPERSGSTFHKDPNGTNAWNAVIQGSKYWLMFPPSVPQPPGVFVSEDSSEVTSPLSIAEYLLTFHAEARQQAGCLEGICRAGELLFVPSGWWHLVVNLEAGIALTQNFITNSQKHVAQVLSFLKDKPDQVTGFSKDITNPYELFVERLREKYPELLDDALEEVERRNGGKKRRWEEVVGHNDGTDTPAGGFSFGFGGDDLNDEIP